MAFAGLPIGKYLTDPQPATLVQIGAVHGEWLQRGEWWRLFSACFVHIGILHLLVNMFALAMMGPLGRHAPGHTAPLWETRRNAARAGRKARTRER